MTDVGRPSVDHDGGRQLLAIKENEEALGASKAIISKRNEAISGRTVMMFGSQPLAVDTMPHHSLDLS